MRDLKLLYLSAATTATDGGKKFKKGMVRGENNTSEHQCKIDILYIENYGHCSYFPIFYLFYF